MAKRKREAMVATAPGFAAYNARMAVLEEYRQERARIKAEEAAGVVSAPASDPGLPPTPEVEQAIDPDSPAVREEAYRIALAVSAQGDDVRALCDYAELVFGVRLAAHHVQWVTEILSHKRVVITAPPESAKTTVSIVILSWWIGKHPATSSMIVSAGEDLAAEIARKVADTIESNPNYRLVFPYVIPHKGAGWSMTGYEVIDTSKSPSEWARLTATKKDPTLISGGVGSSSINGRRVTGIAIGDDLHDRASKSSDRICAETVGFVKDTLLSRLTEEAHLVINQTRWNRKDAVAYLRALRRADGTPMYAVFEHPAIVNGESYWPERWPLERLEEKRIEVGPIDFRLVYLGDDKAMEGTILKAEWLIPYPATLIRQSWERFFGVDFARRIQELTGGSTRDPDHFALACIVNTNSVLVLEDGYDGVVTMGEAEEEFFTWAERLRPKLSAIEVNGSGAEFYGNLLRRMNARGIRHPLKPIRTTRNKGERLSEFAADFSSGLVKVSDAETPFLVTFRDEWLRFGESGVKDDALDAAYFAHDAASHLLPYESRNARLERAASAIVTSAPADLIDRVFFAR